MYEEIIQRALNAAHEAIHKEYPRSEWSVLVVAVPIANGLLAETDPSVQASMKEAIVTMIVEALPKVEWPFAKAAAREAGA